MKHLTHIALSLLITTSVVFSQQRVEGSPTTISTQAAKELANNSFNYEFVEFPIDQLEKAITKKKNTVSVKIGKQIDDTWTIEENELRYDYLGINKWDENGNPLPNKPICETYLATSKNQSVNIRFAINADKELSGFVHDLKTNTMTHFRSISMMTSFKEKGLEKNKVAIYAEKFQNSPALSTASYNLPSCNIKWLIVAVETDAEFPIGTFFPVLQEVDYILYTNLTIRTYFKYFNWNEGTSGYPYTGINTITFSYFEDNQNFTATRTDENSMFTAFINNGWAKNQVCNMGHLLTGRKLRNYLYGNSGGYSNFSSTLCNGTLPLSMSSNEFQSTEQVARTMVHELGHNLAGTTKHENDAPYNGTCIDGNSYNSSVNPTPNTLMCPFIVTGGNTGAGGRTMNFSTNFKNDILAKLNAPNNISCLAFASSPTFGQAYYNGVAINNTPFFASSRNGSMTININNTNYDSSPTLTATVNPTSVYLGSPYVNGSPPNHVGGFSVNAPNSVNNATFSLQSSNACGTSSLRTIPVVFGTGYRLYPNPVQSVLTVAFVVDKDTKNAVDFLPESVILLTEKSKELKRNEPKKNYLNKANNEATQFEWDLSSFDNGTYYLHINYGAGVIFKEKILVQK